MLEKIVVLLVVGVVALMFFGNRLPQVLGDLGKGVRAFKAGLNEGSSNGEANGQKRAVARKKVATPRKAAKKTK